MQKYNRMTVGRERAVVGRGELSAAYYYCVFIFSLSASSSSPPSPSCTNQWHRHPFNNRKEGRERDSRLKRERWTVDTSLTASFLRNPPFPSTHLFSLPPLFPLEEDWRMPPPSPTPSAANGYFRISPSCLFSPPPFLSSDKCVIFLRSRDAEGKKPQGAEKRHL